MSMQGQVKRFELEDGSIAEVVRDFYNPLVGRRELTLVINHALKPTPMRISLRMKVAEVYSVDITRVYVKSITTEYGLGRSTARVNIYDSVERVKAFEPEYIIERNGGINPFEEAE
ncbi:MAG: 30S ribosomal protein S24e [Desulfurococcales archaeon]|nr:30S ribosomal protein S24e [Desulfurococcales archaeon]